MSKSYLYGAKINGIQSFIFGTNELKEIVGASQLVENICSSEFILCLEQSNGNKSNTIINTAGNIKHVFSDANVCSTLLQSFYKRVIRLAPGITLSQAVVEIEKGKKPSKKNFSELERKLRVEQNKQCIAEIPALMISRRSRKTAKAGVCWSNDVVIDANQKAKRDEVKDSTDVLFEKLTNTKLRHKKDYPFNISDLTEGRTGKENWIAVVHIDGNNLGNIVQELSADKLNSFSKDLNSVTIESCRSAYSDCIYDSKSIRPILIGGDDVTVIIRGDLAIDFTHSFLRKFESLTKEKFGILITACAGIAYTKPKYPFHYAAALAEELCSYAKIRSKNITISAPSSLMFYKVQSSFAENYEREIVDSELITPDGLRLDYGPYFLNEQDNYWTVDKLNSMVKILNKDNAPKSALRTWLSELFINKASAQQLLDRIKEKKESYFKSLELENALGNSISKKTHIHDLILISNISGNENN